MTTPTIELRMSESRVREVELAAQDIDAGRLVVLPTDTLFAVAAGATRPHALDTLWSLFPGEPERSALAWHAPSADRVVRHIPITAPAHRRLVRKLCPGQVTFAVRLTEEQLDSVRRSLGVEPGVLDNGREVLFRVPAQPTALAVLERAASPVVMTALPDAARSRPRSAEEAGALLERTGKSDRIARIIADEAPPLGKQSTLIRLTEDGGYEVARHGACEERYIKRQIERRILFVCSGNTCRSPMAEAIAGDVLASGDGLPLRVASAGTTASAGAGATPEAQRAVESLGIRMHPHASQPLTREMIHEADLVLCMTDSHAAAARAIDPASAEKIQLLDPSGRDIPDPIGHPQRVYDETARRIREAIEQRKDSIDSL